MKISTIQNLRLCLLGLIPPLMAACSSPKPNLGQGSAEPQTMAKPSQELWILVQLDPLNELPIRKFTANLDSTQHLWMRSFPLDLDPKIQSEQILSRAKLTLASSLGPKVEVRQNGDSLWFKSKSGAGIALLGQNGDSLYLRSIQSSHLQTPALWNKMDSIAPKLKPIAQPKPQTMSSPIEGYSASQALSTLPHSFHLQKGDEHYYGVELQISDAMGKDDWVNNALLAFEKEPTEITGHWQSIHGDQIYRFQSDQISGQVLIRDHQFRMIWTPTSLSNSHLEDLPLWKDTVQAHPQTQAALLNLQGLQLTLKNENLAALSFYEKAFKLDSSEIVYLVNCAFVYQSEGLYGPGLKHLSLYPQQIERSSRLSRALGGLHEMSYNFSEALKYYQNAEKFLLDDEENRIDLSDALWGLGYQNPSLDQVMDLYEKAPSQRLGIYVGKTLVGMDEYESAVKILREVKSKWGVTPDLRQHLALALTLMDQNEAALGEAAAMTKESPDSAEFWFLRGQIEYNLRKFKKSAQSLDRALKLQKDYSDAYTLRSIVASYLGESQFAPHARPIAPVEPLPKFKELYFPRFNTASQDSPLRIHSRIQSLSFHPKSGWKKTETQMIQVMNAEGASSLDELSYRYLPGYDQFYPNAILILDSNLNLKSSVPTSKMTLSGEKNMSDSAETRVVHIPIQGLQKGDYLLAQVSYQSQKGAPFPFVNHQNSTTLPIGQDIYRIFSDSAFFSHENYGGLQMQKIQDGPWQWQTEQPFVLQKESYMPSYSEFGSGFMVAPRQSWAQAGENYYALLKRQLGSSLSVQEKAFELKGALTDPYQIALHMNRWVKTQLEYEHIRFGNHSILPTKAAQTLKNRRGDCKDKSALLQALLAAVNIPSDLALVNLDDQVFEGMVSTEQFDHMVVHIPANSKSPEMWLDPSEGPNTLRPIPYELENKVALILRPDLQSAISLIPTLDSQSTDGAEFYHALAVDQHSLQVRDSIVFKGKFADYFRTEFERKDNEAARLLVQKWLSEGLGQATVHQVKLYNAQEYDKDFVITTSFQLPPQVQGLNQGRYPLYWEKMFLNLGKGLNRNFPLRIPQEHQFLSNFKLLSPSAQWQNPPIGSGAYTQAQCQNRAQELKCQWNTLAALVNPEDFGEIYQEWENLQNALNVRWNKP